MERNTYVHARMDRICFHPLLYVVIWQNGNCKVTLRYFYYYNLVIYKRFKFEIKQKNYRSYILFL